MVLYSPGGREGGHSSYTILEIKNENNEKKEETAALLAFMLGLGKENGRFTLSIWRDWRTLLERGREGEKGGDDLGAISSLVQSCPEKKRGGVFLGGVGVIQGGRKKGEKRPNVPHPTFICPIKWGVGVGGSRGEERGKRKFLNLIKGEGSWVNLLYPLRAP